MITLQCQPAGERPTEVRIGPGLRRSLAGWSGGSATFLLADRGARAHHDDDLPADWPRHLATGGETLKSLAGVEEVLRAMARAGIDRKGRLLALGGGTVGDAAGLCASLYLRGIDLWMVPTTLLAMVDSSIGGKNAANLPEGKNLVGTIHPPSLVVIDPDYLATLPEDEFRSGLGEVLKVAIGLDPDLFAFLEGEQGAVQARAEAALATVVRHCIEAKIRVVEADLRESGPRRLLNLGHTLGHALESQAGYRVPHGICVARGLHFALRLATARGACPAPDAERAQRLLTTYGFGEDPLPRAAELMTFVRRDKKAETGAVHFVVPTGIGSSATVAIGFDEVERALSRQA